MRRLAVLALALVAGPSAVLADGCPPTTCATTSVAPPGSPVLLVRPSGRQGPAQAYDLASGVRRFWLAPGVLSADGRTFVSAARAKAKRTTVARFDARTGSLRDGRSLRGRWTVAGVSAKGGRVVLVRLRDNERPTTLAVNDEIITLAGNYEFEALSPDGRRVFLIHWRRAGYDLQQYDRSTRRLSPTRLDDPSEKMSGVALNAVASRDGRWLLTLYLKDDGETFVHALDLRSGVAHCVDLPLVGDFDTVGATALSLSPDGRRLYLASPLLGWVTTVDLGRLRVVRSADFTPTTRQGWDAAYGSTAAATPNGRMLAFSGGGTVWLYDTAYGVVRRPIRAGYLILGLGFHPQGRRLLAIGPGSVSRAFDAATGKRLR